jgi:hypothetical protein
MEQQVEDLRPDSDRLGAPRASRSRSPRTRTALRPFIAAHRHGPQAIDSTVIIAEARAGYSAGKASGNRRNTGALSWFVLLSCPLSWTEIQAKFKRASRPLQGFPATDPASFAVSNTT